MGNKIHKIQILLLLSLLLLFIIIIFFITFMQGIYKYIPKKKHVYSVAAVLYVHFLLHVMLFHA
jgi:hypothetical protein